jgi:hypothetical protein
MAARGDGLSGSCDTAPRKLETGFPLPAPGATRIVIRAHMPAHKAACRLVSSGFPHSRSRKSSSQVVPSGRISGSPRLADERDDERRSELCHHDLIFVVAGSYFANSARVDTASKRDSNCMRRLCTRAECLAGHNSQSASSLMIRNVVDLRFRKASQQRVIAMLLMVSEGLDGPPIQSASQPGGLSAASKKVETTLSEFGADLWQRCCGVATLEFVYVIQ